MFRGVEFTDGVGGPTYRAKARKEVILSAGAINTPHILLNSGIGNSTLLTQIGITPLVNLPSVGQNLSDHPVIGNQWTVKSNDTFESIHRNATLAAIDLDSWTRTRTGSLVDGTFNNVGWLRIPSNSTIFQKFSDPSPGPNTGHFEILFTVNIISKPILIIRIIS